MQRLLGVGLLVILCYTVDNLSKCLVFFYNDSTLFLTMLFWSKVTSCVSSIGFFIAFFVLLTVFNKYAVMSEEKRNAPPPS